MPLPLIAPVLTAAGAFLSRFLFTRLGAWLATAAVFLGLELAMGGVAVPAIRDMVISRFQGIPGAITAWMGVLRIDVYVTMILSAYAAACVKKALVRRRAAP